MEKAELNNQFYKADRVWSGLEVGTQMSINDHITAWAVKACKATRNNVLAWLYSTHFHVDATSLVRK